MQDTRLFSTKLTFPWGLSYFSPSPQSKGRFYEITDVGLANMLNLIWKYVEKEKKKENPVFFKCSVSFASSILNMCQAGTHILQGGGGGRGVAATAESFETWRCGDGGHLPPSHTHTPTQIFQNALELFVGRSKPLRNNHRV